LRWPLAKESIIIVPDLPLRAQRLLPALLHRAGHEAIRRIDGPVAPFGILRLEPSTLQPLSPVLAVARWLPDAATMTIRKVTPNKSIRITWIDGGSSVEVCFWVQGPAKSQVAVQHSKLESPEEVDRRKAYWAAALSKLQELLEGKTALTAAESVVRRAQSNPSKRRKTW